MKPSYYYNYHHWKSRKVTRKSKYVRNSTFSTFKRTVGSNRRYYFEGSWDRWAQYMDADDPLPQFSAWPIHDLNLCYQNNYWASMLTYEGYPNPGNPKWMLFKYRHRTDPFSLLQNFFKAPCSINPNSLFFNLFQPPKFLFPIFYSLDNPSMQTDIAPLDPSLNVPPAMLIDPEDRILNHAINSRGYSHRNSLYRASNMVKDSWEKELMDYFGNPSPLLASYDVNLVNSKRTRVGTSIFSMDDFIFILYKTSNDGIYFHFWSAEDEVVTPHLDWIIENLYIEKVANVLDEQTHKRKFTFWGATGGGYEDFEREVILYKWDKDLADNYTPRVRNSVNDLLHLKPPLNGGKIIILHGEPGTGKTSFLRSLAREWSDWCHVSVITDPEVYLGNSGSVLQVLTWDYSRYVSSEVAKENSYHLLIIEDADELISKDSKDKVGQALSRLLNLGDGLLGQSTNLIICITTNKPIDDLNPALIRHGRCLANIHFDTFTGTEAKQWLEQKGGEHGQTIAAKEILAKGRYPLATLYSLLSSSTRIEKEEEKSYRHMGTYL